MEKVKDALSCNRCKESINIIKTTSEKIQYIEQRDIINNIKKIQYIKQRDIIKMLFYY